MGLELVEKRARLFITISRAIIISRSFNKPSTKTSQSPEDNLDLTPPNKPPGSAKDNEE